MKQLYILFSMLFIYFGSSAQVLYEFIPSRIQGSTDVKQIIDPGTMESYNLKRFFGVKYLKNEKIIASIKSGIYDFKPLDYDEKQDKVSNGQELVNIDTYQLGELLIPILEYNVDGNEKFMSEYSLIIKDPKTFEFENFLDIKSYTSNRRQLRYIINAASKEAIKEILLDLTNKAKRYKIKLISSDKPLEKLYISDWEISNSEGKIEVFAVGSTPEFLIYDCYKGINGPLVTTKRYLIGPDALQIIKLTKFNISKSLIQIIVTDINATVIFEKQIGVLEIKPSITQNPDENMNKEIMKDQFNLYPNSVINDLTLTIDRNSQLSSMKKKIIIYSHYGDKVLIKDFEGNEIRLDLSSLRAGLYYTTIYSGKEYHTSIITKI